MYQHLVIFNLQQLHENIFAVDDLDDVVINSAQSLVVSAGTISLGNKRLLKKLDEGDDFL